VQSLHKAGGHLRAVRARGRPDGRGERIGNCLHARYAAVCDGQAVISTEIADIFRSNSLKNGLLPIVVPEDIYARLLRKSGEAIQIDVVNSTVKLSDGTSFSFPIDGFARHCLVEGIDQLGFLQKHLDDILQFEEKRSWTP
jgi:3-isopropylmalate/(R)-2-methylmalate dehydratase small subunit